MMSLFFPAHARVAFGYVAVANMDNVFLAAFFETFVDLAEINHEEFNYRFTKQDFGSTSLFDNSGDIIMMWALAIVSMPIMVILSLAFGRILMC